MLNEESWEPCEHCLPPRTCLPFLGLASTRPRSTSPTSTLPTAIPQSHQPFPTAPGRSFASSLQPLLQQLGNISRHGANRHQIRSLGRALPVALQKFWKSCGSHGPAADLTEHWGWLISVAQSTEHKAFTQHKE